MYVASGFGYSKNRGNLLQQAQVLLSRKKDTGRSFINDDVQYAEVIVEVKKPKEKNKNWYP